MASPQDLSAFFNRSKENATIVAVHPVGRPNEPEPIVPTVTMNSDGTNTTIWPELNATQLADKSAWSTMVRYEEEYKRGDNFLWAKDNGFST